MRKERMAMIKTKEESKNDKNSTKVEVKAEDNGTVPSSVDSRPKPAVQDTPVQTANLDGYKDARTRRWEKKMRFQPKSITAKQDEKHEYYKKLVDDKEEIEIPMALPVIEHSSQYTAEINTMLTAIKQHSTNRTAVQCLPRHMRRRAASHNSKRLPLRLRELAKQQHLATGGDGKGAKTARRKKRRRRPDLQSEYAKRTGKQGWLETHLWHAKRFTMSDSGDPFYRHWGHRVALRPTDKSHRAGYRGVAKHCVVQDISYLKCVEVEGSKKKLCKLLKRFLDDKENPVTDQVVIENQQETKVVLYDKDKSPQQCIGPAAVMWIPTKSESSSAVWIWIHPLILNQLLALMTGYASKFSLEIRDISDSLNRISLVGPKSSVTLLSILRTYSISQASQKEKEVVTAKNVQLFIAEHEEEIARQHSLFVSVMKDCHQQHYHGTKTATEHICCDGATFPLVVDDPRLTLPLQKTIPSFKATKESVAMSEILDNMEKAYTSPLWDGLMRQEASSSRLPDHVVSTRRNESKFQTELEKQTWSLSHSTPVPVMLVRKGGCENSSSSEVEHRNDSSGDEEEPPESNQRTVHGGPPGRFSSGWDLILPSNWSMAFWIPLIYHRAKAVGLKQELHTSLECKIPHFPRDYPDTDAGRMFWKAEEQRNHTDYYKKPPSKRPNMSVLGSPFPFAPYWTSLFNNSKAETKSVKEVTSSLCNKTIVGEGVLVSSDIEVESKDSNAPVAKKLKRSRDDSESDAGSPCKVAKWEGAEDASMDGIRVLRDQKKLNLLRKFLSSESEEASIKFSTKLALEKETLVCVKISPLNKGIPFPVSSLYLPTPEDVSNLHKAFHDLAGKGLSECVGPIEPPHWDPYRKERKLATQEAKKNRKRKKEGKVKVVRNQPYHFQVLPSKDIIGFVTSGDFLFSFASGGGIGFISMKGLISLVRLREKCSWLTTFLKDNVQSSGLLALMRNAGCPQYRFVTLDLVL